MNQRLRDFKMPFGKFKGETLEELYISEKGYLEWCLDNLENDDIRSKIEAVFDDMKDTRIY